MTPRHLVALATVLLLLACKPNTPQAPAPPVAAHAPAAGNEGEVLVEVNGVAVTRDELSDSARGPEPHGGGATENESATLRRVIEEELISQRAVQLGLDQDPTYRTALRAEEARLRVFKRGHLVTLFERWQDGQRSTVTEADARAYYDANAARIRSEVRVGQILLRDEAAATQALADLRAGTSFDAVARRGLPVVPGENERPWELPYMRWSQVPEAWQQPLQSLQTGQITEVLRGPNHRYWILKLIDRRERPELTFDAVRDEITQTLQAQRLASLRAGLREDLRRNAQIHYYVQEAPQQPIQPPTPTPTPTTPPPQPAP